MNSKLSAVLKEVCITGSIVYKIFEMCYLNYETLLKSSKLYFKNNKVDLEYFKHEQCIVLQIKNEFQGASTMVSYL